MSYFSKQFEISKQVLEDYGAVDISLDCDSFLFIDPCLIALNEKYKNIYTKMINYFSFLKDKKLEGCSEEDFQSFCHFNEINNTWLGYCKTGNKGNGLAIKFCLELYSKIDKLFTFTKDTSRHIEKVFLFEKNVSLDKISDLISNLILEFLCEYSQTFAKKYLSDSQVRGFDIEVLRKNDEGFIKKKRNFLLPFDSTKDKEDFILLTPKDILVTKKLNTSESDLNSNIKGVMELTLSQSQKKELINATLERDVTLEREKSDKKLTKSKVENIRKNSFISYLKQNPKELDYYFLYKFNNREEILKNNKHELSMDNLKNNEAIDKFIEFSKITEIKDFDKYRATFIKQISLFFNSCECLFLDGLPIFTTEKDLTYFFNYIYFNVFGININKVRRNNFFVKFAKNFYSLDKKIKPEFTKFISNNSLNKSILLFCNSIEEQKDLIEYLKQNKIGTEINKTIYIINYFK